MAGEQWDRVLMSMEQRMSRLCQEAERAEGAAAAAQADARHSIVLGEVRRRTPRAAAARTRTEPGGEAQVIR